LKGISFSVEVASVDNNIAIGLLRLKSGTENNRQQGRCGSLPRLNQIVICHTNLLKKSARTKSIMGMALLFRNSEHFLVSVRPFRSSQKKRENFSENFGIGNFQKT